MRIRYEAVLAFCSAANPGIATKAQELLENPAPANDQAMLRVSTTKASSKRGEMAFLPKPAFAGGQNVVLTNNYLASR